MSDRVQIKTKDLPSEVLEPQGESIPDFSNPDCLSLKENCEDLEKILICTALKKAIGNRTHAAKLLEASHRTLLYKLKKYEIC